MGFRQDIERMDLSFEGWVRSHFHPPWERFTAMNPNTPSQPQHVIDERASKVFYHNIDMSLGFIWWFFHASRVGGYAASNSYHFYRLAQNMRLMTEVVTHRTFLPVIIGNYVYDELGGTRRSDMVDQHGFTPSERVVHGFLPAIGLSILNILR